MLDTLIRLAILLLVFIGIVTLVQGGRLFVARQKRLALTAAPVEAIPGRELAPGKVRILAFGSVDCHQCHTLQQPALRRLQTLRGDEVDVVEIDAPGSPELARRYRILTLPSTVVLNLAGEAHAINYGFANLQKLQKQIDAALTPA